MSTQTVMPRLIDHTLLDAAERCEVEAFYRYAQHLDSGRPSAAPLFGQAVHAGVRAFYETPFDTVAILAAVETAWGTAEFDPKEYRTIDYAKAIVAAYAVEYPPSKWDFELVMNERYLEDATECGIVDRVVRRKLDGQLYVLDLKTTGLYLGPAWQEQWRHSQQAARYLKLVEWDLAKDARAWAVGGSPGANRPSVTGFWCDAIHVNKRHYPKSEDFVRVGPFPYSEALRAELTAQRAAKGSQILKILSGAESPIKNTSHCFRWQSVCPFLRFCVADPADRADMVALALATGELVEKVWSPKERD